MWRYHFFACKLTWYFTGVYIIIIIIGHLKYFAHFWLGPLPQLILHNQPVLTKLGRCGQYTIDLTAHLIWNKIAWWNIWLEMRLHGQQTIDQLRFQAWSSSYLFASELKRCSWLSEVETQDIRKTYCLMNVIYFLRSICRKHLYLFLVKSN